MLKPALKKKKNLFKSDIFPEDIIKMLYLEHSLGWG
jgi:hypothetical protein